MEIKEFYCRGTMLSHEADYWRCKLNDRHFPLFGIAEREDYIAIGFLGLNDLIHARFMFSEYPEVIRGEDCMVFPRCIAGTLEFSQILCACAGRFRRHDLSTLHVAFLSIDDRDEFVRLLDGKMKPC
jgi:hypothetical protein